VAAETLSEPEKMQRVPGIVFADGPCGRRARIAGTGLDVFELIDAFRSCGEDRVRLADAFDHLTASQINAAFNYYTAFPDEIDLRLVNDAAITSERLREMLRLNHV
jgi:uncharacterized protein (DUF433 family)